MIVDLLLINIISVILIDFLNVFEPFLFRPLWHFIVGKGVKYNGWSFKPFSCSLCFAWWSGLFYLLITGNITLLTTAICLLMAWGNEIIKDILMLIKEYWARLINKLL